MRREYLSRAPSPLQMSASGGFRRAHSGRIRRSGLESSVPPTLQSTGMPFRRAARVPDIQENAIPPITASIRRSSIRSSTRRSTSPACITNSWARVSGPTPRASHVSRGKLGAWTTSSIPASRNQSTMVCPGPTSAVTATPWLCRWGRTAAIWRSAPPNDSDGCKYRILL